jgi:glycine cleavage system H protein
MSVKPDQETTMRFTKDHEWVELDGDVATVGITAYAAEQLGDVVFVELPEVGKALKAGDGMAVVESVKAASDVYAPISGEVVAANGDLPGAPEMVNQDPENGAWIVRIKVSDTAQIDALMDRPAYETFLDTL